MLYDAYSGQGRGAAVESKDQLQPESDGLIPLHATSFFRRAQGD